MPGTALRDLDLVTRAKAGDAAAFTELVRLYQDRVYNLAARLVSNRDDAADVAQEAFLAAFEGLDSFRGESAFYTWLYSIVVNKALARRRSVATRKEFVFAGDDPSPVDTASDPADGPDTAVLGRERAEVIAAAIAALPEEYRAVVVLKDIEGLEYEAIADVVGVALGTVKSRLHRGRLALRDALRGYLGVTP